MPEFITQTWVIFHGCGNSNTCSQTVTRYYGNPPVINCPGNIVITSCTNTPVLLHRHGQQCLLHQCLGRLHAAVLLGL